MVLQIKLRSEQEGIKGKADPKSLINTIKAFVGRAVMGMKAPGAFSIPVNVETAVGLVQGEITFKAIPSAMDGHFLYNMSGSLAIAGLPPMKVNGNLPFPKDDKYYLDTDTARLYAVAKKAVANKALTEAEQALLDDALNGAHSDDASLSAGESTGDEEAEA